MFAFPLRAVLIDPKRLWRLFSNFVKGNDDIKFDSFLQSLKQRFFTKRAVKGA